MSRLDELLDEEERLEQRPRHWRQRLGGSTLVEQARQQMRTNPNRCNLSFGLTPDEAALVYSAIRTDGVTLATFLRRALRDYMAKRGVVVAVEMPWLDNACRATDLRATPTPEHLRPVVVR